jgi:hypothetical protein
VGPPVYFLKVIPRKIFFIQFVKSAPEGITGCTRTIPPKRSSSQELPWRTLRRSIGRFVVCQSMLYVLGKLIKAERNTNSEHAIRPS